ncbi:hypothetical protein B0T09DRAFT_132251 [Sordaria sp. MPI-SDFR-AT-0083]|nr:hypothetical protein B0T09DRAFT_132251 [Sordaria sp. MPI-SDFR-AT-0083]
MVRCWPVTLFFFFLAWHFISHLLYPSIFSFCHSYHCHAPRKIPLLLYVAPCTIIPDSMDAVVHLSYGRLMYPPSSRQWAVSRLYIQQYLSGSHGGKEQPEKEKKEEKTSADKGAL